MADDEHEIIDEEGDEDDVGFVKTLTSDIDDKQALTLLMEVKEEHKKTYTEFSREDMEALVKILSVLKFNKDDTIMEKGEQATFAAIILKGVFNAVINPELSVPLKKGVILGEMALFMQGKRACKVACAEEGILAVISYEDLMKLDDITLQIKLIKMFGYCGILKLKKSAGQATDEEKESLSSEPIQESLFRNRLKKSSDGAGEKKRKKREGANTNGTKSLRAARAEAKALRKQVRVQNREILMLKKFKNGMSRSQRGQIEFINNLEDENEKHKAEAKALKKQIEFRDSEIDKLNSMVEERINTATETLTKKVKAVEDWKRDHADVLEQIKRGAEMQEQLESELDREKERSERIIGKLEQRNRQKQEEIEVLSGVIDSVKRRVEKTKKELGEALDSRDEFRDKSHDLTKELEEKTVRLRKQMTDMTEMRMRHHATQRSFHKLLTQMTFRQCIKSFRLRRKMRAMHEVLHMLGTNHVTVKLARDKIDPTETIETSMRHTAEHKRQIIKRLEKSRASVAVWVSSLEDELASLIRPIQRMIEEITRLQDLSDSFFHRNIELTNECQKLKQLHGRPRMRNTGIQTDPQLEFRWRQREKEQIQLMQMKSWFKLRKAEKEGEITSKSSFQDQYGAILKQLERNSSNRNTLTRSTNTNENPARDKRHSSLSERSPRYQHSPSVKKSSSSSKSGDVGTNSGNAAESNSHRHQQRRETNFVLVDDQGHALPRTTRSIGIGKEAATLSDVMHRSGRGNIRGSKDAYVKRNQHHGSHVRGIQKRGFGEDRRAGTEPIEIVDNTQTRAQGYGTAFVIRRAHPQEWNNDTRIEKPPLSTRNSRPSPRFSGSPHVAYHPGDTASASRSHHSSKNSYDSWPARDGGYQSQQKIVSMEHLYHSGDPASNGNGGSQTSRQHRSRARYTNSSSNGSQTSRINKQGTDRAGPLPILPALTTFPLIM